MTTKDRAYVADFVLAGFLIPVSILVFAESLKLRPSPYEALGPAAVPQALAVLLVVLSVPVLVQGMRKWRIAKRLASSGESAPPKEESGGSEPKSTVQKGPQRPFLSLLTGIVTIIYIFAIQLIGFRTSSIVLLLFLGTMIHRREQKLRPVIFFPTLVGLAVGMIQLLYFVFTRVLVVNLP